MKKVCKRCGEEKELEQSCTYLAFSGKFYPSLHYGSFPLSCPSEHRPVMDYVINNRLSRKFDLINTCGKFGKTFSCSQNSRSGLKSKKVICDRLNSWSNTS